MKPRLSRRNVALIAAVLLLIVLAAWLLLGRGQAAAQRYRMQPVERGDISQSVSANGTLNPVILVNVGTQVSGTVRKLHVDFNDRVDQGQVLAELDDTVLAAQARQDEAALGNALAALQLAGANEQRARSLHAQEYISTQDLDSAVQAKKSAQAQVDQARAQVARSRANLGYSVIRSPVSGVVVDRQIDVGQTVAASFQTPTLFKIAQDLSKMQIDSSFAEADIGRISVGQPVHFSVDAFPDRGFEGKVRQIRLNPTTQQNVVTYNVVVEVDNPDKILLPGMTAYVNITIARRNDALLVPNAALRFKPAAQPAGNGGEQRTKKREAGTGTVYVIDGERLRPVVVTPGITDSRNTEIVAGALKPGDSVVIGEVANGGATNRSPGAVRMRMF